ncbi:MAG: polymer-forming cytoskeletal protein [Gammaproteobacteria bacterium]|nr:polymer-forming cytoskeletal protein [Gammaproteobacteria bacterium]
MRMSLDMPAFCHARVRHPRLLLFGRGRTRMRRSSSRGHTMSRLCITGLLVLAALAAGRLAAAESADEARASIGSNRFIAGAVVELDEDVDGSAFLAGGRIHLDAGVARNAWIAGGAVEVRGPVGRRLHAAGGEIRIDGQVGDDLRAAGGRVRVGREARVDGDAALAGGSVEFEGTVAGDLRAYGDSVSLNGTVHGDVTVAGEGVHIGPEARIHGELRYRGATAPEIAPGAEITGGLRELRGGRHRLGRSFRPARP